MYPRRTRLRRCPRHRAIAGNWCAGAPLDDDLLDVPGYRLRTGYRPATSTGIAPDVRLPVRRYRKKGA